MCDSQSYPAFCQGANNAKGCTQSVADAISNHSLTSSSEAKLEICFLNGAWGDDNSNVLLMPDEIDAANDCNTDGANWKASNPSSPLPPRPR